MIARLLTSAVTVFVAVAVVSAGPSVTVRSAHAQTARPAPAVADPAPPTTNPREVHGRRTAGGVALGAVAGGALGLVGFMLGGRLPVGDEFDGNILGGQLGFAFGVSFGVYAVGEHPGSHGSFLFTLLGAAVGSAPLWVELATDASLTNGELIGLMAVLPTGGALVGYWLSHHDDAVAPAAPGALLRVDHGDVRVGLPLPTVVGPDRGPGLVLAGGRF